MSQDYQPTPEQFLQCVSKWKMETLRDDGLYRHLRFKIEGGGFLWFDIVTWPGKLVITGDCETFTFSRLEDMFEFFRQSGSSINPGYWQEKILDGRDRVRKFDWDRFRAQALAAFDRDTEYREDHELREEARQDLIDRLDCSNEDECGAVQIIREYTYRQDGDYGNPPYFQFSYDDAVPDGMDWDYHYIWCCRAITWGIKQYDQAQVAA